MRMLFLLTLLSLSYVPSTLADVRCTAKVTYNWKPADKDTAETTMWKYLESQAKSEDEARQQLSQLKARAEVSALEDCRTSHERLASCLAHRLSQYSQQLQSLGFSARKDVQDAIKKECESLKGVCQEVKIEDPTCVTAVSVGQAAGGTPAATTPGAGEEEKKKDEGKKK